MKATHFLWLISLLGITGSLYAFQINKNRGHFIPYYIGTVSGEDACVLTWTRAITTDRVSNPLYYFTLAKGAPCSVRTRLDKAE